MRLGQFSLPRRHTKTYQRCQLKSEESDYFILPDGSICLNFACSSTQRKDGEQVIPFADLLAGTRPRFRGQSQFASLLLRTRCGPLGTWGPLARKTSLSQRQHHTATAKKERELFSALTVVWAISSNLLLVQQEQRQSDIFCGVYRVSNRPCEGRAGPPKSPVISSRLSTQVYRPRDERPHVQSTLCHGERGENSKKTTFRARFLCLASELICTHFSVEQGKASTSNSTCNYGTLGPSVIQVSGTKSKHNQI